MVRRPPAVLPDLDPQYLRLARGAAGAVVVIGLLTLIGWIFGVRRLESFAPALGETKGNTAVAFIALGAAAWLHVGGRYPRISMILGALTAALGLATLIEYVTGAHLGIDQLLVSDRQGVGAVSAPGRMGVQASIGIVVAGVSVAVSARRSRPVVAIETGVLVLAALGLLAVVGYVFGVPRLASGAIGQDLNPLSLQTAIAFLLFGAAMLLAHPREGVVLLLRSAGAGGVLIRRLIVPVIALPVLLGYLRLKGQEDGLYGTADGVAIYTAVLVVVFASLVWQAARTVDRYDVTLSIDEQRWRAIFDADRIGVVIRDVDARLLECNRRFAEIFGFTPGELVGTYPADIMTPDEAELAMVTYPEAWDRPQSGVDVDRSVTLRDGRTVHIRVSVFAVSDPDSRPLYQVILVDDLTARRRMEDELAHTRRIESIGRLAGGVAHELNNKLAVILGFNELVANELGADHPLQDSLREVRAAAEHSAALTHDLLSFGRQQMLERRPLKVSEISASLVRILRPALGEHIHLVVADESAGALVLGDRAQIEQVLVNLSLNGRDAMPDGGRLTIRTTVADAPAVPDGDGGSDDRRRVAIAISDTGVGMSEEVRDRIFEPFFTTKEFGQGAGLGLATALGIVVQSGGTIDVDSAPGRGTTVVVSFPEVSGEAGGADHDARRGPAAPPVLRVLLVEDEDQVRQLVSLLLADAGHTVTGAASAAAALVTLADPAAEIDLLLTDMILTDLRGDELARRARELRPALRVVYMSGYEDRSAGHSAGAEAHGILAKPFTEGELAAALRDATVG
jgi:PAS domain S-box-containing protein